MTKRRPKAETTKRAPAGPAESGKTRSKPDSGAARSPARDTRRHKRPGADKPAHLVLVVDDFKDGRDLVVETLEFAGFRTLEAGDGIEALAKCQTARPDLVLMDLSLPGLDGWEVTRRLKGAAETRDIRVIALTAHAQSDALERARDAGADEVITKPCLPSEIVERVREVLGTAREEA